jgi:hypothetical protein
LEEETFEHVLRCSLPATVPFREELLEVLSSNKRIHTPEQVIITIMHGFQVWLTPMCPKSRAPTAGSLKGQDILLTTAYHEQLHSIGWYRISLGRVSKYWTATIKYYRDQGPVHMDPEYWTSLFINYVWNFTTAMWKNRNQIVHVATSEDQAIRELEQMKTQIRHHYDSYTTISGYVLPRHEYLFTHRSLLQRLQLSYDGMKCWLRSVDEARQILTFQENYLRETSQQVMNLFHPNQHSTESSSSADSTYTPSDLEDATVHTDSTTFCSSASSTEISDTDSITDSLSLASSDSNATVYIQSINRYLSHANT